MRGPIRQKDPTVLDYSAHDVWAGRGSWETTARNGDTNGEGSGQMWAR